MSVLDKMRSGTDSTFMQILLAAVLISFVWFGWDKGRSAKGAVVATVNGHAIPDTELNRRYAQEERYRQRMLERGLSDEEEAALRAEIKQDLVKTEVTRQEAERLGLEVSGDEIARFIRSYPPFKNEQGLFDKKLYDAVIRNQGYSDDDFKALVRRDLLVNKVRRLVAYGGAVSEAQLREKFIADGSRMDVTYAKVAPQAFSDKVNTEPATVETFISENGPKIEETYKADYERLYNLPEKVHLRVIQLPIDESATADSVRGQIVELKKQADGGADFAGLATANSKHPTAEAGGDMGETGVPALDASVAEAIAGLSPGQTSEPVVDANQARLFQLVSREPARTIPLEEARGEVARRLIREAESPKLAAEFAEKVFAGWKEGGAAPEAQLALAGLKLDTTGPIALDGGKSPFGPPQDLLTEAAKAPTGLLSKVYESSGVYWVAALTSRTVPDGSEFDAKKDDLEGPALGEKRKEFLNTWLDARVASASVK